MFTVSSNRLELLASRLDHLLAIAIYTMYLLRYSCNMRLCLCAREEKLRGLWIIA